MIWFTLRRQYNCITIVGVMNSSHWGVPMKNTPFVFVLSDSQSHHDNLSKHSLLVNFTAEHQRKREHQIKHSRLMLYCVIRIMTQVLITHWSVWWMIWFTVWWEYKCNKIVGVMNSSHWGVPMKNTPFVFVLSDSQSLVQNHDTWAHGPLWDCLPVWLSCLKVFVPL